VFITDCLIPDLKEISELMCMEETWEDRKLRKKEVFNLHSSLNIVREIKSLVLCIGYNTVQNTTYCQRGDKIYIISELHHGYMFRPFTRSSSGQYQNITVFRRYCTYILYHYATGRPLSNRSLVFHFKFHSVNGCIKINEHTSNTRDFCGKVK
jgi:hypothetical protein